jgi:hypothetical protein
MIQYFAPVIPKTRRVKDTHPIKVVFPITELPAEVNQPTLTETKNIILERDVFYSVFADKDVDFFQDIAHATLTNLPGPNGRAGAKRTRKRATPRSYHSGIGEAIIDNQQIAILIHVDKITVGMGQEIQVCWSARRGLDNPPIS